LIVIAVMIIESPLYAISGYVNLENNSRVGNSILQVCEIPK